MTRNVGRRSILAGGALLAFVLCVASAVDAWAQAPRQAVPPKEPSAATAEEDASDNVFLPADRSTLQKLADSRKLIAEGRFGEAVRNLGAILESPEDFFYQPNQWSPVYRSLKTESQRLIGQMPREGRELYELQYGARARRLFDGALQTGDTKALAEVSRRFFHTRSGYEATFLLGLDHFDHGRPLAGALTLERLREAGSYVEEIEPTLSLTTAACWLQAGMSEKAREVLVALRKRQPTLRVTVAGREVPIFSDDSMAVNWLSGLIGANAIASATESDSWRMFRGNASRNGVAAGGMPLLNAEWRVASSDDPKMETYLKQFQRQVAEESVPTIPALFPLAVGDVVLMRTASNLLAVDFSTGKRLWEVPEDDTLEMAPGVPAAEVPMRRATMMAGVRQRLWVDMTYGTLSSDGRDVFAIEDLEVCYGPSGAVLFRPGRAAMRNLQLGPGMNNDQPAPFNRLAAYDIRTGRLKWNIGGPSGPHALRQAETFFLGPPLPLMGQLYVMGENKGEVRLLVLDGATGNLLWSQQLAVSEQGIAQDVLRRGAGASPSYADGVLVCPTSAGAIVGVELATRSLLWGFPYGRERGRNRTNVAMSMAPGQAGTSRWSDGDVCIADGRVLAAPVGCESLYCLSLIDGKELWRTARQNDLYVAAVDKNRAVLVGRRAIRALRMADGKPTWEGRTVTLPNEATPSGHGFLAGDQYFLPLSSAEVARVDLTAGKIAEVTKSRKESVPGNLICYRGWVISQGMEGVEAFYQLKTAKAESDRRLAANGEDADALSLRGQILLEAGKRSEAIVALRHAYQLEPDPRTRELLRETLLDGLRTEFVAYRDYSGQLERLLDEPEQRATYFRVMAEGLRQAGQWASAFAYYEKLIDREPRDRPLDQISKNLSVRRDRWVQNELALLRGEADDAVRAKIDAAIELRRKAAMESGSVEELRRFCDYFDKQPAAAEARAELARRLHRTGHLLEEELITRSDSVGRVEDAQAVVWPKGKIEIAPATKRNGPDATANNYGRHVVEMRGDPGPFLDDITIHYDEIRHMLSGNDAQGRQRWQLLLASEGSQHQGGYNRVLSHARAQGHLLLVVLSRKIFAIDMLGSARNGSPRLIWSQDLFGSNADPNAYQAFPWGLGNAPWQWQRQLMHATERASLLGPVSAEYVCFPRGRSLVAVDPRNGETLWIRQDVAPGSELFGDDDYVFVLSASREEATVLRAADGAIVGTRKTPRQSSQQTLASGERKTIYSRLDEFCLATIGRQLVLWWPEDGKRTLALIDPFEGRDVWSGRTFSAASHTSVVDNRTIGVMEPDGRFVLIDLRDGRTIADVKLEAEPTLIDITLLASGEQYFLLTRSSPMDGNPPANIQQILNGVSKPIYRGNLYAFDRQGKLQWPKPTVIENQFLLLEQPPQLPVLTFGCLTYEQKANGEGRQRMSVLVIDKRNGRVAYKTSYRNNIGLFSVSGDATAKMVDLMTPREIVKLTFTDKPLPPAEQQKAKSQGGSGVLQELWNSVENALGRLLDDLSPEGE